MFVLMTLVLQAAVRKRAVFWQTSVHHARPAGIYSCFINSKFIRKPCRLPPRASPQTHGVSWRFAVSSSFQSIRWCTHSSLRIGSAITFAFGRQSWDAMPFANHAVRPNLTNQKRNLLWTLSLERFVVIY